METSSTVLFIDSVPFGYTLRRTVNRLEWHPAGNPSRSTQPPRLSAECCNGVWKVAGTCNADLLEQIMDEIAHNRPLSLRSDFSAAL